MVARLLGTGVNSACRPGAAAKLSMGAPGDSLLIFWTSGSNLTLDDVDRAWPVLPENDIISEKEIMVCWRFSEICDHFNLQ